MNYRNFAQILTFGIIIILVIWGATSPLYAPFKEDLGPTTIAGAIGGLFVIALLIERFLEIFVSVWRAPEAEKKKNAVNSYSDQEKSAKAAQFKKDQQELTDYQSQTKSLTLLIGFALSVLVCVAGIGLISDIIDLEAINGEEQETQKSLLRVIDIILTASLLAGGSDGMHQFVSSLETFFKETKKKLQNSNE